LFENFTVAVSVFLIAALVAATELDCSQACYFAPVTLEALARPLLTLVAGV